MSFVLTHGIAVARVFIAVFLLSVCASAATAPGLLGTYFSRTDLTSVAAVHKGEAVNFAWNGGAPDAAVAGSNFSARWRGNITPTVSGAYTISVTADDGVRLWLNQVLVVDKWIAQGATEYVTPITLTAGAPVAIVLEYYQGAGGSALKLAWTGPGITKQNIPLSVLSLPDDTMLPTAASKLAVASITDRVVGLSWAVGTDNVQIGRYTVLRNNTVLGTTFGNTFTDRTVAPLASYSYQIQTADAMGNSGPVSTALPVTIPASPPIGAGTGLTVTFFSDSQLSQVVSSRTDSKIDVVWGANAPAVDVPAAEFSARWQGQLLPRYSEAYKFTAVVSTNARVFINNQMVIDAWSSTNSSGLIKMPQTVTGSVTLIAGVAVPIRVDYVKRSGSAEAHLSWESTSVVKAIIPMQQLFPTPPTDPLQNALTSANASLTSPAWLEGTAGSAASVVTVAVNGADTAIIRGGNGRWFADSSSAAGKPPGIVLTAGQTANAVITTNDGQGHQSQQTAPLTWVTTDLTGKTSATVITVRAGDSLLVTATKVGGGGTALALDSAYNGTTFVGTLTGTPGQGIPVSFATAGVRVLAAQVDGIVVGSVTVRAIGAQLNGPIACQVSYQRSKDVTVSPAGVANVVSFVSSDPDRLIVSVGSTSTSGASLRLRPLLSDQSLSLQARINGVTGPLIVQQKIDVFRLGDSSFNGMQFVQDFPDGSILTQAKLTLSPHVPDMSVTMSCVVSGVTFDDSSTTKTFSSNLFALTAGGPNSEYGYRMILKASGAGHLCHNTHVYQNGVRVSY